MRSWPQMDLWDSGTPLDGRDLIPTRVLQRHPSCGRVLDMIRQVRLFFPELDGTSIKVGLTRSAAGFASRDEPWIWVNPHRLTRHTIAHEFVHLLQWRGHAPAGEKSADLVALARHPMLADDAPWYLRTPPAMHKAPVSWKPRISALLHELAREALRRREKGLRTYLRWFESELSKRWDLMQAEAELCGRNAPMQEALFPGA